MVIKQTWAHSPVATTRFKRLFAAVLICGAVVASTAGSGAAQDDGRIAAVVNEDPISVYDLVNRIRLVMLTSRLPNTPEIQRRLSSQVLRNLIDERLQLQEAKRLKVEVPDKEVDALLAKLNQQNRMEAGTIERMLARGGIDANVLRAKLRAENAWSKVVRRQLQRQVSIGSEEVDEELDRLKTVRNQPRQRVAEIFLSIDSEENEDRVMELANRLIKQIRSGARFTALAREFSQSSSAAVGGDMGWVSKGQLDPALEQSIAGLKKGEIAEPVRTLAGVHILMLVERASPQSTSSRKTTMTLAQIVLPVAKDATDGDLQETRARAQQIRNATKDCASLREAAKSIEGPKSGTLTGVTAEELPEPVRDAVATLRVGETTQPIRVAEGYLVMTLCNRKEDLAGLPTREQIQRRLGNQRLNLHIQRYMRDLRRSAFVDIRG
jgi:peptidyl-prolyl cis-trans isomerase SurA